MGEGVFCLLFNIFFLSFKAYLLPENFLIFISSLKCPMNKWLYYLLLHPAYVNGWLVQKCRSLPSVVLPFLLSDLAYHQTGDQLLFTFSMLYVKLHELQLEYVNPRRCSLFRLALQKKTPKIGAGNGLLEEPPGKLEIEAVLANV